MPLLRVLGPELGGFYRDVHAAEGVELLLGTGVEAIEGSGRAERVRTSDGRTIDCAAVVVGIGVAPRTSSPRASSTSTTGSSSTTACAPASRASSPPATWPTRRHPLFERRVRVEHWANALEQGPAAARSMLGRDVRYDKVPYFFSDQYDVGMEYAGLHDPSDELVLRGDTAGREFIAFWLRGDRLVAGMNVNVWDVSDDDPGARRLAARRSTGRGSPTPTCRSRRGVVLGRRRVALRS